MTTYPPIGTPRPDEPQEAFDACVYGVWVADRLRAATPAPVERWPDIGPPRVRRWDRWRVRIAQEAA
jgi:hypothetical protein